MVSAAAAVAVVVAAAVVEALVVTFSREASLKACLPILDSRQQTVADSAVDQEHRLASHLSSHQAVDSAADLAHHSASHLLADQAVVNRH